MTEKALTREKVILRNLAAVQIIARNLVAVQPRFNTEAPDTADNAIAVYDGNEISWEGPSRGIALTEHDAARVAYIDIFKSLKINKSAVLRQFATEQFVSAVDLAEGCWFGHIFGPERFTAH